MEIDPDNTPPDPAPNPEEDLFGPVIHSYTRAQALADGFQIDVSEMAKEAGFKIPVFLTATVYNEFVKVPEGVTDQDATGRLWDILWMLYNAIRRGGDSDRLPFQLYVRNTNASPGLVNLVAECGPRDLDDPSPAITIMRPDED